MGQLLECPVCFEMVKPPAYQCCHGHILCSPCRMRSSRCPICRVQLGRRGRCLIADKLYDHLMEEKFDGNTKDDQQHLKQLDESSKELVSLQTRIQPLRPTNYCSIFKDIFSKKKSRKDFYDESSQKSSLLLCSEKINCPTGKSCQPIYSRNDLFTHLFRSHDLPVTQYYCHPGDVIKVKFQEKTIHCFTFPQSATDQCQFFLVKYLKYPNEMLCWIWYLGKMLDEFKYRIKLKNKEKHFIWMGKPIPISLNLDEVFKQKDFVTVDQSTKSLYVQILTSTSN